MSLSPISGTSGCCAVLPETDSVGSVAAVGVPVSCGCSAALARAHRLCSASVPVRAGHGCVCIIAPLASATKDMPLFTLLVTFPLLVLVVLLVTAGACSEASFADVAVDGELDAWSDEAPRSRCVVR